VLLNDFAAANGIREFSSSIRRDREDRLALSCGCATMVCHGHSSSVLALCETKTRGALLDDHAGNAIGEGGEFFREKGKSPH
jgi:hypothetical protein